MKTFADLLKDLIYMSLAVPFAMACYAANPPPLPTMPKPVVKKVSGAPTPVKLATQLASRKASVVAGLAITNESVSLHQDAEVVWLWSTNMAGPWTPQLTNSLPDDTVTFPTPGVAGFWRTITRGTGTNSYVVYWDMTCTNGL